MDTDRKYTGPYAREEIIVDLEGKVCRLRPIVPSTTPKRLKIKYASSPSHNDKSAGMDCQRAAKRKSLQRLIKGEEEEPSLSFDNRQTHQTKAASSIDLNKDREKSKKLAELHRMIQAISFSNY